MGENKLEWWFLDGEGSQRDPHKLWTGCELRGRLIHTCWEWKRRNGEGDEGGVVVECPMIEEGRMGFEL